MQKINKKNRSLEQHYKQTKANRQLQKVLPNNSRIHILSKCIQNTNQGISYSGPIYKTFLSIHIIQSKFSDHSESKLEMNCRKICGKIPKYLETGDTLLSSILNRARINSKMLSSFAIDSCPV